MHRPSVVVRLSTTVWRRLFPTPDLPPYQQPWCHDESYISKYGVPIFSQTTADPYMETPLGHLTSYHYEKKRGKIKYKNKSFFFIGSRGTRDKGMAERHWAGHKTERSAPLNGFLFHTGFPRLLSNTLAKWEVNWSNGSRDNTYREHLNVPRILECVSVVDNIASLTRSSPPAVWVQASLCARGCAEEQS